MGKNWARVRLGHEAVMLEDARKTLEQNRANVDSHRKFFDMPEGQSQADDMHIGDVTHTHYHQPKEQPTQSSGLAKWALGAAMLGSSIGLPLAGALMLTDGDGSPAIAEPADFDDTNTQYGLRIFKDGKDG